MLACSDMLRKSAFFSVGCTYFFHMTMCEATCLGVSESTCVGMSSLDVSVVCLCTSPDDLEDRQTGRQMAWFAERQAARNESSQSVRLRGTQELRGSEVKALTAASLVQFTGGFFMSDTFKEYSISWFEVPARLSPPMQPAAHLS